MMIVLCLLAFSLGGLVGGLVLLLSRRRERSSNQSVSDVRIDALLSSSAKVEMLLKQLSDESPTGGVLFIGHSENGRLTVRTNTFVIERERTMVAQFDIDRPLVPGSILVAWGPVLINLARNGEHTYAKKPAPFVIIDCSLSPGRLVVGLTAHRYTSTVPTLLEADRTLTSANVSIT